MTAAASAHPAPAEHAVTSRALWFGLFGAPVVWSVQLLVNFALVSHSCFPGSTPRGSPTIGSVWTITLIAAIVSAAVALGAWITAFRSWRRTRAEHHGDEEALLEVGEGRTRFMAIAGILLGTIFLFGIVMNALPVLLNPHCG